MKTNEDVCGRQRVFKPAETQRVQTAFRLENYVLQSCYTAGRGNILPAFRDIPIWTTGFLSGLLTPELGTERFPETSVRN